MKPKKVYDDLIDLLNKIRVHPQVYLGTKSLTLLKVYADGFTKAYHYNDEEGDYFGFYPGFQEWIQKKYDITIQKSWCNILIFFTTSEEQAFNLFFEEFDLFLEEQKSKL